MRFNEMGLGELVELQKLCMGAGEKTWEYSKTCDETTNKWIDRVQIIERQIEKKIEEAFGDDYDL